MNNILILRESDLKNNQTDWRYLTKSLDIILRANLVILIKNDGTYELVKNRNGSNGLLGKCGELLDTNTFLEDFSKQIVDLLLEIFNCGENELFEVLLDEGISFNRLNNEMNIGIKNGFSKEFQFNLIRKMWSLEH